MEDQQILIEEQTHIDEFNSNGGVRSVKTRAISPNSPEIVSQGQSNQQNSLLKIYNTQETQTPPEPKGREQDQNSQSPSLSKQLFHRQNISTTDEVCRRLSNRNVVENLTPNMDLVPEWISNQDQNIKRVNYEFKNRRQISFKQTSSNLKQRRDTTPD